MSRRQKLQILRATVNIFITMKELNRSSNKLIHIRNKRIQLLKLEFLLLRLRIAQFKQLKFRRLQHIRIKKIYWTKQKKRHRISHKKGKWISHKKRHCISLNKQQ